MDLESALNEHRVARLHASAATQTAAEVRALEALRAAGVESRALRVGERAPPFRLADVHDHAATLDDLAAGGHALLLFVCAGPCEFCVLTLAAYGERAPRFRALRTRVVAICPVPVAALQERWLPAPGVLLSDPDRHVSRAYGLVVDELAPSDGGAETLHARPLAAAFLVDADGSIQRAAVEVDFRRREDPDHVLAALARDPCGRR